MSDDELFWCVDCYCSQRWKHEPRRPPPPVAARRLVAGWLRRVAEHIAPSHGEPEPPAGYERTSCMIAKRRCL